MFEHSKTRRLLFAWILVATLSFWIVQHFTTSPVVEKTSSDGTHVPEYNRVCEALGTQYECGTSFDAQYYKETYPDTRDLSDSDSFVHYLERGALEGRRYHNGPRKLSIILMTKDEWPLIKSWILYHVYVFGASNIYVIDASNAGPSRNFLFQSAQFFGFHYFPAHGTDLAFAEILFNGIMRNLTWFADLVIKVDTDEFLIDMKDDQLSEKSIEPKVIQDGLDALPMSHFHYVVGWALWSYPNEICVGKDVARVVNEFGSPVRFGKHFSASIAFHELDLGGHNVKLRFPFNLSSEISTATLSILHFHNQCFETTMANTLRAVVGHGYISEIDTEKEKLSKLKWWMDRGCTFASCHKVFGLYEFMTDPNTTKAKYFSRKANEKVVLFTKLQALLQNLYQKFDA